MSVLDADKLNGLDNVRTPAQGTGEREVLTESRLRRRIAIERKRTERTREPFLLMLIESERPSAEKSPNVLDRAMAALAPLTRETDIIGWYKESASIGVLFTGLSEGEKLIERTIILNRVTSILRERLTNEQFSHMVVSFHFFPDEWSSEGPGSGSNPALYPDLITVPNGKRTLLGVKRLVDIVGASLLLAVLSPLFLVIAAAVKVTSRGPVLFRQIRIGQHGRRFTFFKFRSMYVNNDASIHQQYVSQLIAGNAERVCPEGGSGSVYKLANDCRITPLGKFLRRSSLDELPQFLNVLLGDMSLVGPRPPLPYELAVYQTWHRTRLLPVKPGITGLWQVKGRSRVTFEEMVRLDLQYATRWTPWLDLKILLLTPGAVIKGAY